ncbi:MAG TPA: KH domain-containing protein [Dongiaceae bacterium]|jgi:predicted RNA-binding protein YlqC (UPF0109 family)|nr:KH domain-containing protein [Dongiaceae bacterium]
MDLKGWVEAMARRLVDRPDQVSVRVVEEDDADVAELSVAPEEMGRVIGRQGRTVQALRTLLDVAGDKEGRAYDLEILD